MWREGLLEREAVLPSITTWWETPMPRAKRPPVAACTVERLAGQHDGMAGIGGDDRRGELDARRLVAGQRRRGWSAS